MIDGPYFHSLLRPWAFTRNLFAMADTHGDEGKPGEPGEPGKAGNGQGGRGGRGGSGGDAERTDWTDQRIDDKFEAFTNALDRVESISSKLVWTFIGFLISAVIGLLAASAMLVVTLAK